MASRNTGRACTTRPGCALTAPQQQLDLLLPPDERCCLRSQGFEPAQNAAFANDAPRALRPGKTSEGLRSEIIELKQHADLPSRALGDHERARCGQRLQACGQVRGFADYPPLLRGTRTNQVADNDKPAGDAEPHIQRFPCRQTADSVDDGEPGADRPLGVVLVSFGIAEVDQYSIAHVLGDKPGEARDRIGDAAVIGADNLSQILGIEALRQRRRADEIAEHHGQLPTLGVDWPR